MLNIKKFWNGLRIVAKTVLSSDTKGELEVLDSDGKLNYHNGSTRSPVVTESHTATVTNKTINADNNTITDLEVDNLKSGVLNTSTTLASASNTQLPSALAVKTYIDDKTAAQNDASEITFTPAGTITSTNVQGAVEEVDTDIQNHINDTSDAHDASAISITAIPTIAATEVQGALEELQSDIDTVGSDLGAHVTDTTDAHDASAISVVPSGNLVATEVQAALVELQSDVDTRATASALTSHTGASTGVHGVTGAVVGTTDSQTLSNKTLTDPIINNGSATGTSVVTPSRLDAKKDTKANLVTYATTAANGQFVFATDEKKMYQVVDGLLTAVGGGGQGLDTIFQLYAEEEVTAWATGDNATFLGGGTLAGTFTKVTSGQLNGDASYRYTQAASSLDDYLASPVQEVPVRFRGQTVSASMFYNYDGANSDIEFLVWDVTNGTRLTETTANRLPATSGAIWKVNLVIPANCTQIRVGFQVDAVNSGKIINFDDIEISADTTKYADPSTVTDWQSYTATGTWTTNATYNSRFRRVGDSIEVNAYVTASGAVTGNFTLNLPTGYVINTTKSPVGAITPLVGYAFLFDASTNTSRTGGLVYTTSSTAVTCQFDSMSGVFSATNPVTIASGDAVELWFTVPIAGLTASNPQIITASESFSTDTAQLTYAGSGTYTLTTLANAPVGTFITFTYAAGGNVRTQTNSAPTQTTADMNVNGIRMFTRTYGNTSTAAQPASVAIQIGKGLKGNSLNLYKSTAKSVAGSYDLKVYSSNQAQGGLYYNAYNESTGILILDCGVCQDNTIATYDFAFSDLTAQSNGYFVINASKSPALVGVPQVQPRIATISDVKASGTAGGTATSGSYQTRTLNTLSDPTGIVTSLSSNQFTLPAGEYYIEASAPAFYVAAHKIKLRNVTDSTDSLLGTVAYATSAVADGSDARSIVSGVVTVSSSKVFEIQHRVNVTRAGNGFGIDAGMGDSNIYTLVKIQKVK